MSFGVAASYLALWALVIFQGVLVLALLKQITDLREMIEKGGLPADDGLPAGTLAPAFSAPNLRGGREVGLDRIAARGLLLFVSATCAVCKGLASQLGHPERDGLPPMVAVCVGSERGCARFLSRFGASIPVLREGADQIAARYRVSAFPTVVLIADEGRIRSSGHPENLEELKALVARGEDVEVAAEPVLSAGVGSPLLLDGRKG